MTTKADAARYYRSLGMLPIPLKPKSKEPFTTAWQKGDIPPEEYDVIFTEDRNIGIILGSRSGNIVDVDQDEATFVKVAKHFIPKTGLCFGRASARGSHALYRIDGESIVKRVSFADADGVMLAEIRGDGHQTMMPPSMHPSGETVEWESMDAIGTLSIDRLTIGAGWAATAAMLIRAWDEYKTRHHDFAGALAGGMYRGGATVENIIGLIRVVMLYTRDHEPDDRERFARETIEKMQGDQSEETTGLRTLAEIIGADRVRRLAKWCRLKNTRESSGLTDDGNAERLITQYGETIRYCRQWGRWLMWDGQYWRTDEKDGDRVFNLARDIPSLIFTEAGKAPTDKARDELARWGLASQSVNRLGAMVRIARTDDRIAIDADQLDESAWLLNCRNGTVNLHTGGIQPHDARDYLTKICPVEYNPNAQAPMWESHLQRVTDGNQNLIDFLQRLCGYSLTGSTAEQAFILLWGPGGTGKTTFIEAIRYVMGGYATNAEPKTFMVKNYQSRASSDLARLQGARLVTSSETEENEKLAVSLVKRLSGTTKLTAAHLYQGEFEFEPTFKLWIDTNHKPKVKSDDDALWDRIILVPFTNVIRNTPVDVKGFHSILRTSEAPGILRWMVEGALLWRSEGKLIRPPIVSEAIHEYREETDTLGQFLEDRCETGPGRSVRTSLLFQTYKTWCRENREHAMGRTSFHQHLRERGFEKVARDGYETYKDIALSFPAGYGDETETDAFRVHTNQ